MVKPQQAPYKISYFMPQQFMVLVDHKDTLDADTFRHFLGTIDPRLFDASVDPERIVTFDNAGGEYEQFSLVPVDIVSIENDDVLLGLIDVLYERTRDIEDDRIAIRSVAPNWVAASAPGQMVTGGPGATPVPGEIAPQFYGADVTTRGTPYSFRLATLAELGSISGVTLGSSEAHEKLERGLEVSRKAAGDAVEIAVLDTAPSPEAIQDAFSRWHEQHPLLRSLLGPSGKLPSDHLRVTYYAGIPGGDVLFTQLEDELEGLGILAHQYDMPDHGLFAAGIAHTLAPNAKVHLVQVLNKWGVGNTETLARGLQTVLYDPARAPSTPLVINCSLTIQLPFELGHSKRGLPSTLKAKLGTKALRNAYIAQVMLPLERILEACRRKYPDLLFVAAAGNDATKASSRRPRARYPAAFPEVIGAGALQTNYDFAPYSNESDAPLFAGVATFGGDQTASGAADSQFGMLGIYTGAFPEINGKMPQNQTGWARWAGTSFAAPVISGILASRLSLGDSPGVAESWMKDLLIELPPKDHILPMKQG